MQNQSKTEQIEEEKKSSLPPFSKPSENKQ